MKLSLLGAVAIAAFNFSAANAADLLPPPPVVEVPEVAPKKGGWYLRGDISYDFQEIDTPHFNIPAPGGVVDFNTAEVDDAFNIAVGIGYQINHNFRVDATAEYVFGADFRGTTTGTCPDPNTLDGLPGAPCTSVDTTEVTKFKVMANAYADLGTYGGFTPYVGAGIGGAYVSYDRLDNLATCTPTPTVTSDCPHPGNGYADYTGSATGSTTSVPHEGESSWRFAYALHAGGAVDISSNLKLDVGYTYSHIEGGPMFEWDAGSGTGTQGYDKGFTDHVIRAGLRYNIW